MGALIEVVLPVFLVIGAGYLTTARGLFSDSNVNGLMQFTQKFAIPCLLFRAISTLDLSAGFDLRLLSSFYVGAFSGFVLGLLGARFLFHRSWSDCVAIGFCGLFSNSVMLGLPIAERAYGAESLAPNFAIISIHAPFCYLVGITAMEIVRGGSQSTWRTSLRILKAMFSNALVIGLALGLLVNLTGLPVPGALNDSADLIARTALPAALFALGGVLTRYRPEGDAKAIAFIVAISVLVHPAIVWIMGQVLNLPPDAFRAAVLTAAMAPGVNTYVFADMYGSARRVAASAVLLGTTVSVGTVWFWLQVLG
ncbi:MULTISPECIES: AEC family transporter [unclassified Meridianimarinicoccus]|uniref:AEC family transporter n=1 Tax=unclassified Meridianimarinicoccus TaxID=2923344 RepID=UPI0018676E8B|nr:AEC family transporter [Fluviibacterium sp. MJW13]